MATETDCELCREAGGELLWQDDFCRVIRVDDPVHPAFLRVILQDHVREMTDLSVVDRERLMRVVFSVEDVVRRLLKPEKINLASLGNVVPHLHWHIIPRWSDDAHFPAPVWALAQRSGTPHAISNPPHLQAELNRLLASTTS